MKPRHCWRGLVAAILLGSGTAHAQTVEVAPFGGYRFGGGFYEVVTGTPVDVDGAPSLGAIVNVRIGEDLFVEAFFTHQEASFTLPPRLDPDRTRWRVTVDHYQVGGLRELWFGRARPFLTGTVGLTRFASAGDNEVRFALSAGGGIKLYPVPNVAVRLEGRGYATFVDADLDTLFCTPGLCIGTFDVSVVWQMEFTAGLAVSF